MNDFMHPVKSTPGSNVSQTHAVPGSGPSMVPTPAHGDIARRAYDIYLKTGSQQGHCQQNWREAEQALKDEGQGARAAQQCGCGTAAEAHGKFTPVMKSVGDDSPSIAHAGHSTRGVRHPVPSTGHASHT